MTIDSHGTVASVEHNVVDKDVIMIAGYEAPIGLSYAKVGK